MDKDKEKEKIGPRHWKRPNFLCGFQKSTYRLVTGLQMFSFGVSDSSGNVESLSAKLQPHTIIDLGGGGVLFS